MRRLFPPPPDCHGSSVRPDPEEPDRRGRAGRGSRRPHTDATFAAVRRLIEESTLSYAQIRARTGVSHASICRWTRDGGWKRPPFAPRANDTDPDPARQRAAQAAHARRAPRRARRAPYPRAGRERVRRSRQARRGAGASEHGEARRPPPAQAPAGRDRDRRSRRRPIRQLCAAGVDLSRAPRAAVEDFLANRERPPKEALPPRGRGSRREWEQWWMSERER